MCLIGFLLIGYTILLRSKPVYTDVGHEGQMFKKFMTQMETLPESVSADETKKQSQVKQIGPVIEHTKKATEPAPAASVESYSQVPTEEAIN